MTFLFQFNEMLHTSYLFVIVYHDMLKLNKTALKWMLFFGVDYVYVCSVRIYNWNRYVVIGIGMLSLE